MEFIKGLGIALCGLGVAWMTANPALIVTGIMVAFAGAWIMIEETCAEFRAIRRDWPRKEGK